METDGNRDNDEHAECFFRELIIPPSIFFLGNLTVFIMGTVECMYTHFDSIFQAKVCKLIS